MPPTTCLSKANIRGRSNAPLIFYLHINAPFLDIFGCARHSPNKFGSALACPKICFEIFGCARQYEQALLHSLARKLAAARHNPSKLGFCSRLAQTFVFNSPLLDWSSIRRLCFTCFSAPSVCYFNGYSRCPIIVGQLHRNYGATTIKGIKTIILLVGTTIKGKKLFFRRITLVFFLFIFLVNGNLVVVDYCTSY